MELGHDTPPSLGIINHDRSAVVITHAVAKYSPRCRGCQEGFSRGWRLTDLFESGLDLVSGHAYRRRGVDRGTLADITDDPFSRQALSGYMRPPTERTAAD